MKHYPRLVIAGTHSGVGKTTVTLALMAALRQQGRLVQPFKAGPDFIDPGHHGLATGRPSRNLDGWMLGETVNLDIFLRAAAGADLSIIEGMMGLFDGTSPNSDQGSTAELAALLGAPVLLVIDGSAIARSAAAMAHGYARFDSALRVEGVLFNRVQSQGHFQLLKEAVESSTGLKAVGYLKSDPEMAIGDRHLGLLTALEPGVAACYDKLGKAARETVDMEKVVALAQAAAPMESSPCQQTRSNDVSPVCIGIAHDPAFCFYYQDNLDLLEQEGAKCVRFSPLHDSQLPDVDLLYFGGGYPELYGTSLAANRAMRKAIRSFAERGGPIYAECGGMMYLTRAIRDLEGNAHDMVGLFQAESVMSRTAMTLGYRNLSLSRSCLLGHAGMTARGHEFHYSILESSVPLEYACELTDVQSQSKGCDGLMQDNTVGLYTHLHFRSQPAIAASLVAAARAGRESR